jgi:two-component system, OmpR family, response regulator
VQSDDGEVHWVLEPEWLLRGVAAPTMGQPTPRVIPSPPSTAPAEPAPVTREPIPFPGSGTARPSTAPLAALGPENVEPLEGQPETRGTGAPSALATLPEAATVDSEAGAPRVAAEPPASGAPAPRRALVAEDSIAARIYLVRLLEQQGYDVHAVATTAELRASLADGPWALVCADGGLPDGQDGAFLSELARATAAARSPLVVLVRDADDEAAARSAGVTVTLRKPLDRVALEQLLARLAPEASASPGSGPGTTRHDSDPREWGAR